MSPSCFGNPCTVNVCRISHRIWKETKMHPGRVRSSNLISCCLLFLHFRCDILQTFTVQCHLDPMTVPDYLCYILFTRYGPDGETPVSCALIDLAIGFHGSPANDLIYFLYMSTTPMLRIGIQLRRRWIADDLRS